MSRRTRILIASAALALTVGGFAASAAGRPATLLERTIATVADDSAPRTPEQQALVDFALGRFEAHGMELPEIHIQFHDSLLTCGGHKGFYIERTRSLHMCSVEKQTMLHEIAHAWANHSLSPERRAEFVRLRGLETWNDHDHPWKERATEHVAEIIAWALIDEANHVPLMETGPDGGYRTVQRLLTIDNSDVETMVEAFEWLTGQEPIFRSAEEWEEQPAVFSPEAKARP